MTTLAIYSNKGGVGKTVAAVNLAYLAARSGLRTLLCDLDPQSSATFYLGLQSGLAEEARGLVAEGSTIAASVKPSAYDGLDVLPADFTHRNLDITFDRLEGSTRRLKRALEPLEHQYDLLLLDCPPTINILAENVFYAADHLLVPIIPTILSVRTYTQMLTFLEVKAYTLQSVHAFFSMVDRRKKMHRQSMIAVHNAFQGVMQTIIPHLSVIEQMGIQRRPVGLYAASSPAARAYRQLWSEVQQILAG